MPKILIVDDELHIVQQVKEVLSSYHYSSGYISRAEVLIPRLKAEKFDLILLDINMPGRDGLSVLSELKSQHEFKDIPVIMLTGEDSDTLLAKCFEHGAIDYITKPIKEVILKARIQSALAIQGSLKTSEERLSLALEASGAGVYDMRLPTCDDCFVNQQFARMYGYDSLEVPSGPNLRSWWAQRIHPEDKAETLQAYEDFYAGKELDGKFEFRQRHKDGRWIHIQSFAKKVETDVNGVAKRVVGVQIDITAQKEVEQKILMAKEKAEEINNLRESFMRNMSHELRTPMNGIIGFASILEDQIEDSTLQSFASDIHTSGQRLLQTLNGILDLANLESSSSQFQLEPINLLEICQYNLSVLSPLAETKDLEILIEDETKSPYMLGDRKSAEKVVFNLLQNAFKFTLQGSVALRIQDVIKDSKPKIKLIIQDTGVGISEDFLPSIFDEFMQENIEHTRNFEGTGLGLTITRRLVQIMNGTIEVESQKGEGTTFTLIFPIPE